jgi:hypothetical protein
VSLQLAAGLVAFGALVLAYFRTRRYMSPVTRSPEPAPELGPTPGGKHDTIAFLLGESEPLPQPAQMAYPAPRPRPRQVPKHLQPTLIPGVNYAPPPRDFDLTDQAPAMTSPEDTFAQGTPEPVPCYVTSQTLNDALNDLEFDDETVCIVTPRRSSRNLTIQADPRLIDELLRRGERDRN